MEEPLDPLTRRIIGSAIAVHRFLGPGLLESIYHRGLEVDFEAVGLRFEPKRAIHVEYRGVSLGEFYPDFVIERQVVVEIKSASAHDRVFDAQVLTYMRLTGVATGLLINFGRPTLIEGLKRFKL